jgi:hypothetical protein
MGVPDKHERSVMKIIDQITAQLADMSHTLKAFPVLERCAAAGVAVPTNNVWRSVEDLDASLNSAFGELNLHTLDGKRKWEARVRLKGEILASGMVAPPEKKLDERAVTYACNLLRKLGVKLPADNKMFLIRDIDAMSDKISISDRIELKVALDRAGLLDTRGTIVAKPAPAAPNPALVRSIFASELEMDIPASGKISVAALNRAMTARDVAPHRRMRIKELLAAAQVLAE